MKQVLCDVSTEYQLQDIKVDHIVMAILYTREWQEKNYCSRDGNPPQILSRFSQVCPYFAFSSKRKSVQKVCLDFLVTVHICITDKKI